MVKTIWQWLESALQQHKTVALLLVVYSKGSSPGKSGTKLAITADKATFGTIGGGRLEYDLSEYAANYLNQEQHSIQLLNRLHHNSSTESSSGQICGGEQSVALVILKQSDLPLLQKIQLAEKNDQPCILGISPQGLILSPLVENIANSSFTFRSPSDWQYHCVIGFQKMAYIIGGGHVSLALTHLLVLLDYKVIVIDQRSGVKTMEENTLASQKLIVPYSKIANKIQDISHAYLFVMTHSHETDQQLIELLADKPYKYLGILGSQHKINVLKKNLKHKISEQKWQSIHAPIGLPIHSHTPMEIAISIAAELIQLDS